MYLLFLFRFIFIHLYRKRFVIQFPDTAAPLSAGTLAPLASTRFCSEDQPALTRTTNIITSNTTCMTL